MPENLTKKAAEMLLKGATLLSDPCPYCKGVRVLHEGNALCVSCGRRPEKKHVSEVSEEHEKSKNQTVLNLEKKIELLSKDLEKETDLTKQQEILKSINLLIETIERLKNKQ